MASKEVTLDPIEELGFLVQRKQAVDLAKARGAYIKDGMLVYEDTHRDEAVGELKELVKAPPEKQPIIKLMERVEAVLYAEKLLKLRASARARGDNPDKQQVNEINVTPRYKVDNRKIPNSSK